MFGNILSEAQVSQLVKNNDLTISGFDKGRFRIAHYPLSPIEALDLGDLDEDGERELAQRHVFRGRKTKLVFSPNEHLLFRVREYIKLPEGISGHFVPSSYMVTSGFALNAGKIDPIYGDVSGETQNLLFGVSNLLNKENVFESGKGFVYMYFLDFRGLGNRKVNYSSEEEMRLRKLNPNRSRAEDDGVDYGDGAD